MDQFVRDPAARSPLFGQTDPSTLMQRAGVCAIAFGNSLTGTGVGTIPNFCTDLKVTTNPDGTGTLIVTVVPPDGVVEDNFTK